MSSEVLIEPAELATLLDSDDPPVLADVRWTLGGPPGRPQFEAAHLPGAHWVDLEHELSGPPEIDAVVSRAAIRTATLVASTGWPASARSRTFAGSSRSAPMRITVLTENA